MKPISWRHQYVSGRIPRVSFRITFIFLRGGGILTPVSDRNPTVWYYGAFYKKAPYFEVMSISLSQCDLGLAPKHLSTWEAYLKSLLISIFDYISQRYSLVYMSPKMETFHKIFGRFHRKSTWDTCSLILFQRTTLTMLGATLREHLCPQAFSSDINNRIMLNAGIIMNRIPGCQSGE